jgi:hypothetical protein
MAASSRARGDTMNEQVAQPAEANALKSAQAIRASEN